MPLFNGTSPLEAGYSMPPEWAPHGRCWMAWPYRHDLWRDLPAAQRAYVAVAQAVARFEPVVMLAAPEAAAKASELCGPAIEVRPWAIDDSWSRDSGPTFLKHRQSGALAGTAWHFNAWGGKHRPWDRDEALAAGILADLGLPCFQSPLFLEGGAIHVDGEGTLITTESCLLNANRNPGLTKPAAEAELRRALGIETVIWLPGDPDETETDGHVDGIACFVRPGFALVEIHPDPHDPLAAVLAENRRALELARDARGRTIEILPLQTAVEAEASSDVFCNAYINFYLANGAVILPSYGIASDAAARDVVAKAFPDREIVQVDVNGIAPGGGGIHCITPQQPA